MKVNKGNDSKEKTLYTGVGLVTPLIFNPDRQTLDKILGIERDEDYEQKPEFEYVKDDAVVKVKRKNEEGEEFDEEVETKRLNVTVWVRETKTDEVFPINFTLYDIDDVSSTGKTKYITQHGKSTYIDSESNLPDWFKFTPGKKKMALNYRIAKRGEAALLEFLAKWTNISPFDIESSLFPENSKKFWNGDMKELNSLLLDFGDSSVMAQFGVRSKEVEQEDGSTETKEYQSISTKSFANAKFMKFFRNYANKNFEGLLKESDNKNFLVFDTKAKIGDDSMYELANFLNNIHGEYGENSFTTNTEIKEYDSSENPLNQEKSIVSSETDADY